MSFITSWSGHDCIYHSYDMNFTSLYPYIPQTAYITVHIRSATHSPRGCSHTV